MRKRLTLLVLDGRAVFVFYGDRVEGEGGGIISRIWPGGEFRGMRFDQLVSLGTGDHDLVLDHCIPSLLGTEPEYESEWRRWFEYFQYDLFRYYVGASSPLEVLFSAYQVFRLELEGKHSPPGCTS